MMAIALAGAKAGTRSCSLASSSVKAAGKRSDLVEKSCPTLMKVGPSFSRDSLQHQQYMPLRVCGRVCERTDSMPEKQLHVVHGPPMYIQLQFVFDMCTRYKVAC